MTMTGPRKIIDLDGIPESKWKIEDGATHLYNQKLWTKENAGCVLCVEAEREDPRGQTLKSHDDDHVAVCLTHGPLDEVQFTVSREFKIKIGEIERNGIETINDVVWIPKSLPPDERQNLLERLADFSSQVEQEIKLIPESDE